MSGTLQDAAARAVTLMRANRTAEAHRQEDVRNLPGIALHYPTIKASEPTATAGVSLEVAAARQCEGTWRLESRPGLLARPVAGSTGSTSMPRAPPPADANPPKKLPQTWKQPWIQCERSK